MQSRFSLYPHSSFSSRDGVIAVAAMAQAGFWAPVVIVSLSRGPIGRASENAYLRTFIVVYFAGILVGVAIGPSATSRRFAIGASSGPLRASARNLDY